MHKEATIEEILNSKAVKSYIKINTNTQKFELSKRHSYYCQVQINMYILNCTLSHFIIYSAKDDKFQQLEVEFDREFVSIEVNGLKKLYFNKMLRKLVNVKSL